MILLPYWLHLHIFTIYILSVNDFLYPYRITEMRYMKVTRDVKKLQCYTLDQCVGWVHSGNSYNAVH